MYRGKYSLVESIYNGRGLLLESGSGMGAQELVAAYLLKHYPAVKTCRVAREKTNDEDVIGYDGKGNPIIQIEVKDIAGKSNKYTGYAEVASAGTKNPVSKQFHKDINWVHPMHLPQIPNKLGALKKGWVRGKMKPMDAATLRQRLTAVAPLVTAEATANPGKWVHSVLYGAASLNGQVIVTTSGNFDNLSEDTFGNQHGIDALKTIAGGEELSLSRRSYGMIKGALTCGMKYNAKKGTMTAKLFKLYFGGNNTDPKRENGQHWTCYCTGPGKPYPMQEIGDKNKVELGGTSGTNVKTTAKPASWVVSAKGSPTFSQAMTTKYTGDKDNYFCSVDGGTINWCLVFGKKLPFCKKGPTKFSPVDSSGNALPANQATIGEPFGGKSHAVYFVCDQIDALPIGSAETDAAKYRRQKKIYDS